MGYVKTADFFTRELMVWHKTQNKRTMPWKEEKDPYKIWLSEIILQQTRVEQGTAYYNNFIRQYPNISKLAAAPESAVFKLWEGLGYYTRCKNLIATAKFIAEELNGKFPRTYEEVLALKGVGPYTAAAIVSFAYNQPYAVVDGNVMRVLARFFAIDTAIDSTEGKKIFSVLANQLIDKKNAGLYNQAIMDFGATVCKPQQPLCSSCSLAKNCSAFIAGKVDKYPVKEKSITKKQRWFYYFLLSYKNQLLVKKRTGKDIWQNLHEFVLLEANKKLTVKQLEASDIYQQLLNLNGKIISTSKMYKQQLTHQQISGYFIHVELPAKIKLPDHEWMEKKQVRRLAFPRLIIGFMEENPAEF
jgi:A/G-specific adenine glycosylase